MPSSGWRTAAAPQGLAALERRGHRPAAARSLWGGDQRTKYPDQPVSNYSTLSYDKVLAGDQIVGISANSGYSVNVGGWSSLAVIDEDRIKDGAEVTLVWGEEGGGSAKPTVERHVQAEVRATISTSPLAR